MKKSFLFLLLALVSSTALYAYDAEIGGIYYNLSGSQATVTSGTNKYTGTVTIPKTFPYGGTTYTVTSIGTYAFYDCRNLTSVSIPATVTKIGTSAFLNCQSLNSVNIPSSVTSLGENVFGTCLSLTSITLPDGLTSIPANLFNGCGLKSFTIPSSVTTIGDQAFRECKSLTSVSIPSDVTSIGAAAFMHCTSLPEIFIPYSVTSIGDKAFYNCSSLTSVTVRSHTPPSITENTFTNRAEAILYVNSAYKYSYTVAPYWKEFKQIRAEHPILTINDLEYILDWKTSTASLRYCYYYGSSVTIPASIDYEGISFSVTSIESDAFKSKSNLSAITIPESVTRIGEDAFWGCTSLTSITIPKSVTSIEDAVFWGCSALPSITIPEGVTSIGISAFYRCSTLSSVLIPESVTKIMSSAFGECNNLTSVIVNIKNPLSILDNNFPKRAKATLYVPAGCVEAYKAADVWKDFKEIVDMSQTIVDDIAYELDWNNFTAMVIAKEPKYEGDITVPASFSLAGKTFSVTSIGSYAFSNCSSLRSIHLPESLEGINESAFSDCTSLTEITVPDNVTSIGNETFQGCSALESVTLSSNIKRISSGLFFGCSNLKSIVIPEGVTRIGSTAFWYCTSLASVTLPNSLQIIDQQAFGCCTALPAITLPNSLTSIGESAFYGCTSLTSVVVDIVTPLTITANTFTNRTNATLYVLNGCKKAYAAADVWKEFKKIVEQEVLIDGIAYEVDWETYTAKVIAKEPKYEGDITISASISYHGLTFDVTSIGEWAFVSCVNLTSVNIPEGVTDIGEGAFAQCLNLTSINIPEGVTDIGEGAFSKCLNLTSINIPEGVTDIGEHAFFLCQSLTSIILPLGVTKINDGTFNGCTSLASVNIPESVTSIGDYAFYTCFSLTHITLPYSVTSIGSYAFQNCPLTSVIVERVTPLDITKYDFPNRAEATLYVPAGCKEFYEEAKYWKEFKEIVEMSQTIIVDDIAYMLNWNDLTASVISKEPTYEGDITIPASIALGGNLPFSVTAIGDEDSRDEAFADCENLTSIIIPESVTQISEFAFQGCTSLKEIWCYATTPPSACYTSFGSVETWNVLLVVPEESYELYKAHEVWRQFWIETPTGIKSLDPALSKGKGEWYDLSGRRISGRSAEGHINIIRYSDGTSKKVLMK